MSIIIKDIPIYQHEKGGSLLENHSLIIKDNKIYRICKDQKAIDEYLKRNKDTLLIDGKDKVLLPALVNSHTHSPMSIFRNYASDLSLFDWLFNKIIPKEQLLSDEDAYWGSLGSQAEMIRGGVCLFADMYEHFDSLAQATKTSGMRANLSVGPLTNDWSSGKRKTISLASRAKDNYRKHIDNNGMINIYTELHSVYLYEADMIYENLKLAQDLDTGIHIHLHETKQEIDDCIKEHGKRPIELLEEMGLLKRPILAAHCVHISDSDMELLKKYDINVAENISSNLKLVSGIPRVPEMLEKGINVSFGTDGCASNNNLSIFEEMHIAALVHKNQMGDPKIMPAHQVVEMATINGYRALGFKDRGGDIKEGKLADLILVDVSKIEQNPINEIGGAIVYNMQAAHVDTVIINGKLVMKNRELLTIDEERVKFEIKAICNRLQL